MGEWWTYSLSDFLMFSPRTYRWLFELMNAQAWPAQPVLLAAGLAAAIAAARSRAQAALPVLLALAWALVAGVFFVRHYATINWAAPSIAIAFALQAAGLAVLALRPRTAPGRGALALIAFGLLLQPLVGLLLGRPLAQAEVFGLAPDPTATVTLGLLAATRERWTAVLWIVPLLWCVAGALTLWTMGDRDALLMPAVAAAALVLRLRPRRPPAPSP